MTDHHQLQWGLAMTPPDTKQLIEVTQADRDLAIELLALNGHAFSAQLVLEGEGDQWPDVQAIARHRLSALQQPLEFHLGGAAAAVALTEPMTDETLVGDDGKLTRLPDELAEPHTPDPEAIAKAVQDLKNAMKPDERDEVIARLRAEAVEARNLSHCETVESQRMYRIGQHDALMLASDAIERGDHRTALGEG